MRTLWLAIVGIVVAAGIFARGYQCGHDRTAAAYETKIATLEAYIKEATTQRDECRRFVREWVAPYKTGARR